MNSFISVIAVILLLMYLNGVFTFSNFQKLYEYFFAPWEITVIEEGLEEWHRTYRGTHVPYSEYERKFVKYKYKHKFRPQEKILIKYLDEE